MIELGLVRIHKLLALTPLPWRAIHVAGTNGKGSVCAYVSAILSYYNSSDLIRHTGHRPLVHARFTSPHLVDRWDCITINNDVVAKSVFDEVETLVKDRNTQQGIGASEFEILTATAFEIFTRSNVDIGVVEVGMGGRLDATNVLGQLPPGERVPSDIDTEFYRPRPLATAITSIGLDHQKFLGSDVTDIAAEKAGIIKAGVPVVASRQDDPQVEQVIVNRVESVKADGLTFVSQQTTARDIWMSNGGTEYTFDQDPIVQARWPNGAIAVQLAWKALKLWGRLSDAPTALLLETLNAICRIPDRTSWAGRLETVDISALTGSQMSAVLDGAHNAQSARMLREHVDSLADDNPTTWVLAASQGKDINEMLRILLRPGDSVFAVEFGAVDGMPWVAPQGSLEIIEQASMISTGPHQAFGRGIRRALAEAAKTSSFNNSRIVIAGSLYLVGDVVRLLRQGDDKVLHS
ncbi:hypothetical protein CAC42_7287 [Sphaceloma murrayae]|uniref:Dihydrofolate synthetase n=1 Tax=Sphaceloma murrayae TaxID=2082308 RepID=A0A2K1QX09_9PEZI|nr:hypothetical protein CAC42_7287 [Sphaceloma murrayae]